MNCPFCRHADSRVVDESPDDDGYSFALIPSQDQFAKVELELRLTCGDPPPAVDFDIQFDYMFTGDSEGCSVSAWVNRDSSERFFLINDDGGSDGEWQTFSGTFENVQLSYDAVFTIELLCDGNTATEPAILITDISLF